MRIFQVDAFTDEAFKGNPAGVCVLDEARSDSWMQSVAYEMNLSETAFLLREGDEFNLRWFTPIKEVSLCGHATLASAHVLWQERILGIGEEARFFTKSGLLTARMEKDTFIKLDFPARFVEKADLNEMLNGGLNIVPSYVGRSPSTKGYLYLIEVQNEEIIRNLNPNYELLKNSDVRGIIITSISNSGDYDFVSRYFAPSIGVNEDPVTGSAHCALAPYWGSKLGKLELTGFQASARTGIVRCTWNKDRVLLKGRAVTVFRGEILV